MNQRNWLPWLLCAAAAGVGCEDNTKYFLVLDMAGHGPDQAAPSPAPACTAGGKECVDVDIFRVCHDDGTWGADQWCPDGTECNNGDCTTIPAAMQPCFPDDTQCAPGMPNVVLTCRPSGSGFDAVTCATNTQCQSGVCVGGCGAVGATHCNPNDPKDLDSVFVCDGNVVTQNKCPTGTLCLDNGDGTGQCVPADCDPRKTCTVCGNPKLPGIDPGSNISFCGQGPLGFKWISLKCQMPAGVCDPQAGGDCAEGGAGTFNADCAASVGAECTPMQTRCTVPGDAVQTCDDTGHWGAPVACDSASSQACGSLPDGVNFGCGDIPCVVLGADGVCVADPSGGAAKLRACGPDGKLVAKGTLTDCAPGLCVPTGDPPLPTGTPGFCGSVCADGDSKCLDNNIQKCVNGVFGANTTPCQNDGGVGAVTCVDTTNADGNPRALCAVCAPGKHQCSNGKLQTCGVDGLWGPETDCPLGVCTPAAGDASCVAQCIPNSIQCVGGFGTLRNRREPTSFGTVAALKCLPNGMRPTFNAAGCPTAGADGGCCQPAGNGDVTSCRADSTGNFLGCVVCVGGLNEAGLRDTRCTDTVGTGQGGTDCTAAVPNANHVAVEQCKTDSSGWEAPLLCGAPGFMCIDPTFPARASVCQPCPGGESGTDACSDSALQTAGFTGCNDTTLTGGGYGAAGGIACGAAVADCCAQACERDPLGDPASCQPSICP